MSAESASLLDRLASADRLAGCDLRGASDGYLADAWLLAKASWAEVKDTFKHAEHHARRLRYRACTQAMARRLHEKRAGGEWCEIPGYGWFRADRIDGGPVGVVWRETL